MSAELEQFCILAKAQKGRACATLIQQVCRFFCLLAFFLLLSSLRVSYTPRGRLFSLQLALELQPLVIDTSLDPLSLP